MGHYAATGIIIFCCLIYFSSALLFATFKLEGEGSLGPENTALFCPERTGQGRREGGRESEE